MAATVEKVLNPKNSTTEVMDIYNEWATKYDEDMATTTFKGPQVAAQCLQKVVSDKNAKILDIGAGTGGLGICLKESGYTNVDALDPNAAMLDVAKTRNVYQHFIVDFLTKEKLKVEDGLLFYDFMTKYTYDAIIGSGMFVPGHVTWHCFDELCRITKPGGYIVIISSRRFYEERYEGYGPRLAAAILNQESCGKWKIENQEEVPYAAPYNACISYLVVQ